MTWLLKKRAWQGTKFVPLVLAAGVLAGCPAPPLPAPIAQVCRIETINSPAIMKTDTVQQASLCEQKYYQLCDLAFTDAQNSCNNACRNFEKRGLSNPTDPAFVGPRCEANPITTSIPLYNQTSNCRETAPNTITVNCTLTYTCTCDP